jgi:hypothetical protein
MGTRVAAAACAVFLLGGCDGDSEPATKSSQAQPIEQRRPIALASGKAPDGRRIRIVAFSDAGGPCLRILGLPGGPRQCGRAPSERVPAVRKAIGGPVIARLAPDTRLELYGETRPMVRRVGVRFRLPSGKRGRRTAAIIRVDNRDALHAARIREPFGYFIAFVPARAENVVATARDANEVVLGRLGYDPIVDSLHPHAFIARQLRSTRR